MKKYFAILATILFVACNSSEKKTEETKDSTVAVKTTAPEFKDDNLRLILTSYLSLKDSLVASKADGAKIKAKELSALLKNYTGCENTSLIADKIASAKDIVVQRKEFTGLSSDVIALFKHADLTSGKIYVQHCPMANSGDGGDWLSSENKIQNPYYGSEMMECGAVIAEIKSK
jgi:predicted component of type VI protein secretion system